MYTLPAPHLLAPPTPFGDTSEPTQDKVITDALTLGKVAVAGIRAQQGASVTRYRVRLEPGTAPEKVKALESTVAVATGRAVRYAGVDGHDVLLEIARENRALVTLRDAIEGALFMGEALPFVVGQDVAGDIITADLASSLHPHLLVAGATGSGKSEFLNSLIVGLTMACTPDTLRFLMIDPKRVELTAYERLPHLSQPIVTDVADALAALKDAADEMDARYATFAANNVKSIGEFNSAVTHGGLDAEIMPYLVIIVDELADLIAASPQAEKTLTRLGQLARAAGIHLIAATQRPAADTVPKRLSSNLPGRVTFRVVDSVASRIALGEGGAEKLAGQGDGLWKSSGGSTPVRFQAPLVTRPEIGRIVKHWHNLAPAPAPLAVAAPVLAETLEQQAEREALDAAPWNDPVDNPVYISNETLVAEAGISPEIMEAIAAMTAQRILETIRAQAAAPLTIEGE